MYFQNPSVFQFYKLNKFFNRQVTRRQAASVSYKEDSEERTDSEDLIEQDEAEVPAEPDNAETIERILGKRQGKKGGLLKNAIKFSYCTLIFQIGLYQSISANSYRECDDRLCRGGKRRS